MSFITRDFKAAMACSRSEALKAEQRRCYESLLDARGLADSVCNAPELIRETAARDLARAEARAQEFGVLGSEC